MYGSILKTTPNVINDLGVSLGVILLSVIIMISWWVAKFYEPNAQWILNKIKELALLNINGDVRQKIKF